MSRLELFSLSRSSAAVELHAVFCCLKRALRVLSE